MAAGDGDRRRVVLVADDDQDVRELVVFRLRRAGYEVIATGDGSSALRLAVERSPDVCLLDVMMPDLDGYELTRALRAQPGLEGIAIVLLTASVQEEAVTRGFEAGADDYVKKPFSPQQLLERISTLLERG